MQHFYSKLPCQNIIIAWKVSKYGVFSGQYFPAFGLNTERNSVSLCIQFECGKIQTRNKLHIWTLFMQWMLGQIEWWIRNRPIAKNGVFPAITYFHFYFFSVEVPIIKSWFDVVSTQMSMLVNFVSAIVSFEVLFPFRESKIRTLCGWKVQKKKLTLSCIMLKNGETCFK